MSTCTNCGTAITRGSRTGQCFECFHNNNNPETAAVEASRRYFDAIEAYLDKYQRGLVR